MEEICSIIIDAHQHFHLFLLLCYPNITHFVKLIIDFTNKKNMKLNLNKKDKNG